MSNLSTAVEIDANATQWCGNAETVPHQNSPMHLWTTICADKMGVGQTVQTCEALIWHHTEGVSIPIFAW
jgi:hypothetical protein